MIWLFVIVLSIFIQVFQAVWLNNLFLPGLTINLSLMVLVLATIFDNISSYRWLFGLVLVGEILSGNRFGYYSFTLIIPWLALYFIHPKFKSMGQWSVILSILFAVILSSLWGNLAVANRPTYFDLIGIAVNFLFILFAALFYRRLIRRSDV